jgi:hypothetical protein
LLPYFEAFEVSIATLVYSSAILESSSQNMAAQEHYKSDLGNPLEHKA